MFSTYIEKHCSAFSKMTWCSLGICIIHVHKSKYIFLTDTIFETGPYGSQVNYRFESLQIIIAEWEHIYFIYGHLITQTCCLGDF